MKGSQRHRIGRISYRGAAIIGGVLGVCLVGTLGGCADGGDSKQPSSADRALADPMNYGPKPNKADSEPKRDDSFDKDGLKKDLNNVFNP